MGQTNGDALRYPAATASLQKAPEQIQNLAEDTQAALDLRPTRADWAGPQANINNDVVAQAIEKPGLANSAFGRVLDAMGVKRKQPGYDLARFFGAAGNRNNAPINMLFLGDSIWEQFGAAQVGWGCAPRIVRALQQHFNPARPFGSGYMSANPGGTLVDNLVAEGLLVKSGNYALSSNMGYGLRAVTLGGPLASTGKAAGALTYKFRGNRIQFFMQRSSGSDPAVNISVDGGAAVLFQPPRASGPGAWDSGLIPDRVAGDNNHTIVVTRALLSPSALGFMVDDIYGPDNGQARGFRYLDGSRSGSTASQFSVASGGSEAWLQMTDVLPPDVALIEWMTNDQGQRTVAQYKQDLINVVAALRAKFPVLPLVFVAMFQKSGASNWGQYVNAMREVSDSLDHSYFLDLTERMPEGGGYNVYGLMYDSLHPNTLGHGLIGDFVANALTPQI